ncbi:unnamed protein product [Staurois parvus]|uniref:Uncharacterized protein n=1 Tax=Staurois parvus TaxID=386267 RepID=A0ABN9EA44_9NEOB|nr:unnamed protein product [Staurois parvus]
MIIYNVMGVQGGLCSLSSKRRGEEDLDDSQQHLDVFCSAAILDAPQAGPITHTDVRDQQRPP